ncbi:DUF6299 family protein [Streptomyces bambusae]|uniref:DUF6299 family protein n=1 Tax=Streptomyces bambusae TaxID=1550616 RepID=UPI001CFD2CDF|nr:DUF6299 family protein [Streptomyces bambusae]MCB5166361.1 DUF6299 family protein [Streptomyces bambusae]
MRIPAAALAALAAVAVLSPTATAESFDGTVFVDPHARISPDGTLTLSGAYRCTDPSPSRTVFLSSSLKQDGQQLGFNSPEVVCDGAEHPWQTSGPADGLGLVRFHEGEATVSARLLTLEDEGGLPSPRTLVDHEEPVEIVRAFH